MTDLHLNSLTPYELGKTGIREAIPYLLEFLKNGNNNERRLAASAIRKLAKQNINESKKAIPYLLNNLSNDAPQTRQYSLNALQYLPLDNNCLVKIRSIAQCDDKEYNRKIANKIINTSFKQLYKKPKSNIFVKQLLKEWRNRKSKKLEIPAYCIFPNSTLVAIIDFMPTNKQELMSIKGIGSKIINNYGDEILDILKKHKIKNVKSKKIKKSVKNNKIEMKDINRKEAEQKLQQTFKIKHFYEDQWNTIQRVLNGERLLLIEKTGFGKSLCYQFPATQFEGITIIFSPLIALMRDQVKYLKSLGIPTECINSEQTPEENTEILRKAKSEKIKILYIAPERQENREWLDSVRDMHISMVVVDEAHCISVWGHDFRPAFRRIVNLVKLLPQNFPVLATTATATERVANDIQKQIGEKVSLIRGNLLRNNFHLNVVTVDSEESKMAWLAEFLQEQDGNGLIYTGTRVNTNLFSTWLQFNKISAANYNAGLDPDSRKEIENGLISNKWKCVVSTNALGMGIDKSDIRFIIHTQMPQSPIHYYQEIGRAGRDGKPTNIVLLYNPEDKELPEYFIKNSRPSIRQYTKVIDALKLEPLGIRNLMRKTNLKQTQVRLIRADLIDQGIIKEVLYGRSKKYEYQYGANELDVKAFEELRNFKLGELEKMIAYSESSDCRMDFLCRFLGDESVNYCGKCDNDRNQQIKYFASEHWQNKINEFRNSFFPELKVESNNSNIVNGIASSYYGITNVGASIHRCKYENGGDFPSHLLKQTLRAFRYKFGNEEFDLILYVPPTESGDLVKNFAEKIAYTLKFPISHKLSKLITTKPQKIFQNFILKRDNVENVFEYSNINDILGKSILLLDDIYDSGVTIKEIGKYLTTLGATKIAPLVIAKTVGGNIK
jgi:ATP-dependent DNA helicase RecQ